MQAELKINRGGDKNDLMVIERAGSTTATSNSERGEHKSTLLISFFHSSFLFNFHSYISGEAHLEGLRTTETCQTLLRDKERIHSHSNSCANEAWQWAVAERSRAGWLLAACRLVCRFGWSYLAYRIPPIESSILDDHFTFHDWEPKLGPERMLQCCDESWWEDKGHEVYVAMFFFL